MKILMLGGLGTGGVSTHTKALLKEYDGLNVEVKFYNYFTKRGWRPGRSDPVTIFDNIIKIFRLLIGFPLFLVREGSRGKLVHVQSSGPLGGFLPAIYSSFLKRIFSYRLVTTFHHSKTEEFLRRWPRTFLYVLRRMDLFIVVSRRQKSFIEKTFKGRFDTPVVNIPNGYDPTKFLGVEKKKARRALGIPEDVRVIANVAWIMEKKGHIYLVDAVEKMFRDNGHSKLQFYIIGKGPLLEKMRTLVREKGLEDHMHFLGYLSLEEMLNRLSSADLFVLPSLEEGNPIVMFEALSLGIPFIGTDVGGIPEIIDSSDYGMVVPSCDSTALVKALEWGLGKDWDNEKIRRYGENYTWKKIAQQTISEYDRL